MLVKYLGLLDNLKEMLFYLVLEAVEGSLWADLQLMWWDMDWDKLKWSKITQWKIGERT